MASKSIVKVKLVSPGLNKDGKKTGYYKTTTRNNKKEKLLKKMYDPRAYNKETGKHGMHLEFKEEKIK